MTEDYIFRLNGRGKAFGRSKVIRLAEKLPNAQLTVIDTKICKPVGRMTILDAKKKFI